MSLNLFYDPTAVQALSFALGGQNEYRFASFFGPNGTGKFQRALFTNGLAAGFAIDYGLVLTSNSITEENTADPNSNAEIFPDFASYHGVAFSFSGASPATYREVDATWCQCARDDGMSNDDFADFFSEIGAGYVRYKLNGNPSFLDAAMPLGQLPGARSPGCRCTSQPILYTFDASPSAFLQVDLDHDTSGNAYLFIGPHDRPLLATTTVTSYSATRTVQPPDVEAVSTIVETTPFAYSTVTETPVGSTVTTTPTTTSIVNVAGPTVTTALPNVVSTATATPTCSVYNLQFAKECCPKAICRMGAPTVLAAAAATPAPKSRALIDDDDDDGSPLLPRQEPDPFNDPPRQAEVRDQTLFITSFRTTTTTEGTAATLFTSTTTQFVASNFITTTTAAMPDAVTVTAATVTVPTTVTAATSTQTLPATTQTITVAAPCKQINVPPFVCPRGTRSQAVLNALTKAFLDLYKRFTSKRAPQLAVRCEGEGQMYNY